mgnify:CR=1 FL=1
MNTVWIGTLARLADREPAHPEGQVVLHDLAHLGLVEHVVRTQGVLDPGRRMAGARCHDPEVARRVALVAQLAQELRHEAVLGEVALRAQDALHDRRRAVASAIGQDRAAGGEIFDLAGVRVVLVALDDDGLGRGSARSIHGFNIAAAFEACSAHVVQCGGHAMAAGLTIKEDAVAAFRDAFEAIAREQERLRSTWVHPAKLPAADALRVFGKVLEREYSLHELLRRPDVGYPALMTLRLDGVSVDAGVDDPQVVEQVEIQARYQGYIERQHDEVARNLASEELRFPGDFDFAAVGGLSREVRDKLQQQRPQTLGQASRIQGVTPAAISILLVCLKRVQSAGDGERRAGSAR